MKEGWKWASGIVLGLALLTVFCMTQCGPPSYKETKCNDGGKCIAVNCTSSYYHHSDCLVVFGQVCPAGYDIVYDQEGDYLIKCKGQK